MGMECRTSASSDSCSGQWGEWGPKVKPENHMQSRARRRVIFHVSACRGQDPGLRKHRGSPHRDKVGSCCPGVILVTGTRRGHHCDAFSWGHLIESSQLHFFQRYQETETQGPRDSPGPQVKCVGGWSREVSCSPLLGRHPTWGP